MYKVLLVDDESNISSGLSNFVRWEGLNCEIIGSCADGITALERIKRDRPDILISDIRMPGLNGLALVEKIKELKLPVKTILLTGFPDFEYARQGIQLDVVDFFSPNPLPLRR